MEIKNIYSPEALNFWDRFFNRYKKVAIDEGQEIWKRYDIGPFLNPTRYARNYVIYHIVDRLTRAFTIKKEYLD